MSRVEFKNDQWIDIRGPKLEIELKPSADKGYYYYVPECKVVLWWPEEDRGPNDSLGEIYSISGDKICDIPAFVHPDYQGSREYYRSRFAWVQEVDGGIVSIVMYCPDFQNFRLKLSLATMEYVQVELGVR